jgi:hypothetical protein
VVCVHGINMTTQEREGAPFTRIPTPYSDFVELSGQLDKPYKSSLETSLDFVEEERRK